MMPQHAKPTHGQSDRRGFALLAILWLVVAMAALGIDESATARGALASTRNRMSAMRARWLAAGCAEVVRATTDNALGDSLNSPIAAWDTLDRALVTNRATEGICSVTAEAPGDRLDVNSANAYELRSTFIAAGVDEERADSLADALVDWRDADSVPRPRGAEIAWYRAAGRVGPSNRPFESTDEIRLVRGFEYADSLIALLTVEHGKVLLDRSPLPVIAGLPGLTPEALARVAELRWRHEPIGGIGRLSGLLSEDAQRTLASAYPVLIQRIAAEPDAWIVRVTATSGTPAISVTDELRLVRAGRRAGVTRERVSP